MNKALIIIFLIVGILAAGMFFFKTKSVVESDKVEVSNVAVSQNLYVDPEYGYSIEIPQNFKVESEGKYSKRFMPEEENMGVGPANFIYVSVVTPENKDSVGEVYNYDAMQFEKFISLENIGDSVNLAEGQEPDLSEWFTYTVVAIEDIDQGKSKNFENNKPWEFPSGTTENRFIYGTDENIYILGYYTGGDSVSEESRVDPRVAYQAIKSFKVNSATR